MLCSEWEVGGDWSTGPTGVASSHVPTDLSREVSLDIYSSIASASHTWCGVKTTEVWVSLCLVYALLLVCITHCSFFRFVDAIYEFSFFLSRCVCLIYSSTSVFHKMIIFILKKTTRVL